MWMPAREDAGGSRKHLFEFFFSNLTVLAVKFFKFFSNGHRSLFSRSNF